MHCWRRLGFRAARGSAGLGRVAISYVAERRSTVEPVATAIQTSLTKVGIPVTLNPLPASQLEARACAPKNDLPILMRDDFKPLTADVAYASLLASETPKGGLCNAGNYASAKFTTRPTRGRVVLPARLEFLCFMSSSRFLRRISIDPHRGDGLLHRCSTRFGRLDRATRWLCSVRLPSIARRDRPTSTTLNTPAPSGLRK